MRKEKMITLPPKKIEEIKKIDQKEADAVDEFKQQAERTLSIIQENHFHLRLWKAVGGKS